MANERVEIRSPISRRALLGASLSLPLIPAQSLAQSACTKLGYYKGAVSTQWDSIGSLMKLTEPLSYIDPCGKEWMVPKGAVTDGASIPGFLWSLIGSPFTDNYRTAAVVHDWFCSTRTESSDKVHVMFYNAMLTSKVAKWKALQLYYGVKIGGPSWNELTVANNRLRASYSSCKQDKDTGSVACSMATPVPEKVLKLLRRSEASAQELVKTMKGLDGSSITLNELDAKADEARARLDLIDPASSASSVW